MDLLQDWICMQGNGTTPRVQPSREWLDLAASSDLTLWLEVRSASNPGSGTISIAYESSPTRDDDLFKAVTSFALTVSAQPVITKIRLADDLASPLARWLRWKITASAAGDWSVTFRIHGVAGRAVIGDLVFDPASLPLSGWWRAPYAASPWNGTPSLGASSARSLTEATNPPSAGTAVNGLAPADFDGTNDRLSPPFTVATYVTAAAGSVVALVNIDAINTSVAIGGAITSNDGVFADDLGYVGLFLGGASSNEAQAYIWDGAQKAIGVTVTTGSWQLLQMRWDGTRVEVRLNSASWNGVFAGNLSTLSGTLLAGSNGGATQFFDGRMLELMFAQSTLSNAQFNAIKDYVNARYALSL